MKFTETAVPGAYVIELQPIADERGLFARTWCREEFRAHGLSPDLAQASTSFSSRRGTLRGMHYQAAPHEEAKLVRVTRGSLRDVILDLRPDSKTFKRWVAVALGADDRRMLYVPPGCAHGFLTLEDATEVSYQMSVPYHPESARGVRWDDPAFAIDWAGEVRVISERDRTYPDFDG